MKSAKNDWAVIIFIAFLVISIIAIKLMLAWIAFNRLLFWFDVIVTPLSLIAVITSIFGIVASNEWDREFWYWPSGIALILLLLSLSSINFAYDNGYSQKAIEQKAELENKLDAYELILSIYTGGFEMQVKGMVFDQLSTALCEAAPQTPCDQVLQSYQTYQKLIGWKDSADSVARIWRDIKAGSSSSS